MMDLGNRGIQNSLKYARPHDLFSFFKVNSGDVQQDLEIFMPRMTPLFLSKDSKSPGAPKVHCHSS